MAAEDGVAGRLWTPGRNQVSADPERSGRRSDRRRDGSSRKLCTATSARRAMATMSSSTTCPRAGSKAIRFPPRRCALTSRVSAKAAASASPTSSVESQRQDGRARHVVRDHRLAGFARDAKAFRRRRVHQVSLPARAQRGDRRSAGRAVGTSRFAPSLVIAGDDAPHTRDLFHQKYRGSRYSFGYPACPNLEDQTKLFALLLIPMRTSACT